MVAREWPKEAEELTSMELDEREREWRRGEAEPGRDPATVAAKKVDSNTIVVEVSQVRQQPKSVEEEWMLQEKYGNMKDLEEGAFSILDNLGMVNLHANPAIDLTLDTEDND